MRRGFTLIELLVIVTILATMVTIGVGSIRSGQGAARVKGATRDVYAAIRHARSVALVTGQRVIVNYSNGRVDDEPIAKVEVVSARIMSVDVNKDVQSYYAAEYKGRSVSMSASSSSASPSSSSGGETIEEVLFAPMNESVVQGMKLKVVKGEDVSSGETDVQKSHRISVSSNVDWLLKIYKGAQGSKGGLSETENESSSASKSQTQTSTVDEMTEPVSVVWQTNGAVEPHSVWIYADGQKPEEGLLLKIDRFGAVKVLSGDGREDDE